MEVAHCEYHSVTTQCSRLAAVEAAEEVAHYYVSNIFAMERATNGYTTSNVCNRGRCGTAGAECFHKCDERDIAYIFRFIADDKNN